MKNNKKTISQKIRDFFWTEIEEENTKNIEDTRGHFSEGDVSPHLVVSKDTAIEKTPDTPTIEDTIVGGSVDYNQDNRGHFSNGDVSPHHLEDIPSTEVHTRSGMSPQKQKLFIAVILVFAVFVSSFSGYLFATSWFGGGIAHGDDGNPIELPGIFNPGKEEDNIEKILIIGVDQRAGEASRADTMILAIINTDNPELQLLSIPRDTRTILPGRGYDKLNHAQAYGGPSMLMEAVGNMLDTEVDSYVQLNFNSFKEVIDILGGVEYTVEQRMYYAPENINLQSGTQVLNGDKALQYVRYRNNTGDIGRVERQQKFIKELIDQKLKLRNALKIPELVGEAHRSIRTNISLTDMVSIAMAMKDLENEKITSEMLPGNAQYINGISYWLPTDQKLKDIFPDDPEPEEEEELNTEE